MSSDSKSNVSIDTLERLGRTIKNVGLAVANIQAQLAESNQDRKKDREQLDKLAGAMAKAETQINFLLDSDRRIEQIPNQLTQVQADQKNLQTQLVQLEETIERLIATQEQKEQEVKNEKKELSAARINARNGLVVALIGGVVTILIQVASTLEKQFFPDPVPPAGVKNQVTPSQLKDN